MELKHRNSQKRIYFEDAEYFVTCKTKGNCPFFKETIFCDLFMENLRLCKKLKGFVLYSWVLIYAHFHLLLRPSDEFNVSEIMHFLKRNISRNINFIIGNNKNDELSTEGADDHPRLRCAGNHFMGVDEYSPDIDCHTRLQCGVLQKFIVKKWILKFRFKIKYLNKNPFFTSCRYDMAKFQWQKSYHDHYIRNDDDFGYHMGYIAYNPIKHNMPNGWPYVFTNPKYADLIDEIEL
jgi:REP element-mobilizing transposase RayT